MPSRRSASHRSKKGSSSSRKIPISSRTVMTWPTRRSRARSGLDISLCLAVADDVALGVSGEHDGQAAVDSEADAASPAPGFGELVGEVLRPGQPGAGQVGGGRVEPTAVTRNPLEQWQLPPTGSRPWARHGRRPAGCFSRLDVVQGGESRSSAVMQSHEEELVMADGLEPRGHHLAADGRHAGGGPGVEPGLAPAQTAVLPLQRLDSPAADADGRFVAATEHVAGVTEPTAEAAPGQATWAGAGGLDVALREACHQALSAAPGSHGRTRNSGTIAQPGSRTPPGRGRRSCP